MAPESSESSRLLNASSNHSAGWSLGADTDSRTRISPFTQLLQGGADLKAPNLFIKSVFLFFVLKKDPLFEQVFAGAGRGVAGAV